MDYGKQREAKYILIMDEYRNKIKSLEYKLHKAEVVMERIADVYIKRFQLN